MVGGLGADHNAFGSGDGIDTVQGFSAAEGDVIAVAAGVNGTGTHGATCPIGDLHWRLRIPHV